MTDTIKELFKINEDQQEEFNRLRAEMNVLKRVLGFQITEHFAGTVLAGVENRFKDTQLTLEEYEILKQKPPPPQKTELECLLNEVFE